ncbi:endonuclease [Pseudoalteromonas luteoviolacea]|uniref:endonuclease n=1 Tax=Pseudoalteromonas luteoviolacea TaxID=43657 RepID=UPI001B379EAC|nr:endonuclease [Pseudoalteromonas luteoviolacea]MBQ4813186.1 endonuclease [Pseudoalteromonas luteoviolacea]
MKHRKNHRLSIKTAVLIGLVCPTVSAEINNGSFENWQQNTPSNWSTIDTGITLSQVSSPVKDGQSAASVAVKTATQGNTDLRQTVSVTGGQSYTFSTWVYHTEGNVKARLYVDGYRGYSNENQTGQWQQITYQYTASSSKNIEVGLRFYDTSGFDGSEVVYVDHFTPSDSTTTPPPPPPPTTCQQNTVQFKLVTDNYASETSWELKNKQGQTVKNGSGYANTTTYTESLCLADDTYTFIISDSYGDGICCSQGNGSYELTLNNQVLVSGGQFSNQEQKQFTLGNDGGDGGGQDPTGYYASAAGLSGFALKSQLHTIIKDHNNRGYSALWSFIDQYERDSHFEKDNTVLDRYSEKPNSADTVNFTAVGDQCGSYRVEGDCYNREHSFPKSWFGGKVEPMNSDVHHIFASDGFVNAKRNSYPFGEVGSASYTSSNGSKLGSASGINYSGTVFEPIDQFKGDVARIYFYMATRYENVVAGWQNKSSYGNDVLNGTANVVFEPWVVALLKRWHQQDPVDDVERARNQAAYEYQGNRNPYVDHPEFVEKIW